MRDCMYTVDGIDVRLTNYEIITDHHHYIVLYTTGRQYKVDYDKMPEFLGSWMPKRVEGVPYYNHLLEEEGIKTPIDNNLPTAPPRDKAITPEEQFNSMLLTFMQDLLDDTKSMQEKLNATYLNLKDIKAGSAGESFVKQAQIIANLADKMIKGKLTAIQGINMVSKLLKKDE